MNSFGRTFDYNHEVLVAAWRDEIPSLLESTVSSGKSVLCYGKGRSYGDSCLNGGGTLVDMSFLDRVIRFDAESGLITCEPGVTIGQLIEVASPHGWFVPVTPGTKHVTLGGAVANDVHGKNHHVRGSFGNHVKKLTLLTSDGSCSEIGPGDKLFEATVGGLGLTGIITSVTVQLLHASSWFDTENIKFSGVDEFLEISKESERDWEYTVAWVDTCAVGESLGRGIFMRGNHAVDPSLPLKSVKPLASVPFHFPNFALNEWTVKGFNTLYYVKQFSDRVVSTVHYEPYLYPLDVLGGWNKIYGKRGFYQYQFVIPEHEVDALKDILKIIARSGSSSFLSVLKHFGDVKPAGMLSFARKGVMLALDFANEGEKTKKLFQRLDQIVVSVGGRLYPAKDALMRKEDFEVFYPRLEEFRKYKDPAMSSSFWRRVGENQLNDQMNS